MVCVYEQGHLSSCPVQRYDIFTLLLSNNVDKIMAEIRIVVYLWRNFIKYQP